MNVIYSAKVSAVGGRAGRVQSDDGLLDVALALPVAMGGKGGATNPEQLFAAGYAACFENALLYVAGKESVGLDEKNLVVTATVGIGPNGRDGFGLEVALAVEIDRADQAQADRLVRLAHQVCPYSNAVRGNIEVTFSVTTGRTEGNME